MTLRWRRRPQERPTEILQAAIDVFAERGLAGARVEDIAARAGVSKGTVYLYFSGKEELFIEAIRDKLALTLEGLASAAPAGPSAARLSGFLDAHWAHLCKPRFAAMYRLIMAELHQFPELTRFYAEEVSGKVIGMLADIIREGVERGEFRSVDPFVAARIIVSQMVHHALWTSRRELFTHLGARTDDELLQEVKEFVSAALRPMRGAGT
jgi:AcrR family transcriptional regulator